LEPEKEKKRFHVLRVKDGEKKQPRKGKRIVGRKKRMSCWDIREEKPAHAGRHARGKEESRWSDGGTNRGRKKSDSIRPEGPPRKREREGNQPLP